MVSYFFAGGTGEGSEFEAIFKDGVPFRLNVTICAEDALVEDVAHGVYKGCIPKVYKFSGVGAED